MAGGSSTVASRKLRPDEEATPEQRDQDDLALRVATWLARAVWPHITPLPYRDTRSNHEW